MDKLLKKDLIERANRLYEYFNDLITKVHLSNGYVRKFEFLIRDNAEINGKAWCENDVDHVEINSGVIELYYDYFNEVMEYDRVKLLQRLNIDKDEENLKEFSIEGVIYNNGIAEIFDSRIVDDSKAKLLEIFTARFIVLHELGHIFNGHCELLKNEFHVNGLKFIPMYFDKREEGPIKNKVLDLRTMEMDADAFAATQSLVHLMFLYYNFDSQVSVKIKPEALFYWWSFAIRSHFLTCEDKFMDQKYYKEMTHLPSIARWSMVCGSAMEILDLYDITPWNKPRFKDLILLGAKDAEIKFNKLKLAEYSWIKEIADNLDFETYKREIDWNWDKLRVRLQQYARLSLFDKE